VYNSVSRRGGLRAPLLNQRIKMHHLPGSRAQVAVAVSWLSIFICSTYAQTIAPSNGTQDLYPASISPRFIMNGTQFPDLIVRLAPLGQYAEMSHNAFEQVHVEGYVVNVDASNANVASDGEQFAYLSCDPEAYTGVLDASEVFRITVNSPRANIVILYSQTSDHCVATGLTGFPTINGILTTTDSMLASNLANMSLTSESQGTATILPDLNSYTNSSHGSWNGNGNLGQSPTTAVAMIILYSITGIITALFVVIIVTGAVRAHRNPERYGPRNVVGRGRQSRAKGIARAMLETLPIVKFGDHQDLPSKPTESTDVEMNASNTRTPAAGDPDSPDTTAAGARPVTLDSDTMAGAPVVPLANNADGTDAEGHLGCSICTEDFKKGEELRVLPCNHKFHPDCVDPWLLNVSGTCPLCRIDLRPQGSDAAGDHGGGAGEPTADGQTSTPSVAGGENTEGTLSQGGRRDTVANLRHLAAGSRDERIAALRRLRQERLRANAHSQSDAERLSLARRFRDRFRIRTERREANVTSTADTLSTSPS
jgi:hypothetical protein